jgi:hypothetical protein
LVPVHKGNDFGDFYRWTPQGMETLLRRCGYEAQVRMWGSAHAAQVLIEDMYLRADQAAERGISLNWTDSEDPFPIMVWAVATKPKIARGSAEVASCT